MNIERLKEIINLKNFQTIEKELVKEKYFDMSKDKTLKNISLVPIIVGKKFIRLDSVESNKYNFVMALNNEVYEYPDYEFVWLQVDKYDKSKNIWIPSILKMYAKEKVKNG